MTSALVCTCWFAGGKVFVIGLQFGFRCEAQPIRRIETPRKLSHAEDLQGASSSGYGAAKHSNGVFMRQLQLTLSLIFSLAILCPHALACGTGDLTDAQIAANQQVKVIQSKIQDTYAKTVIIESIVRSGNNILNLDKKIVADSMCDSHFINVYFQSQSADGLRCMTTLEVSEQGQFLYDGLRSGAVCQSASGTALQWLEVAPAQ